MGVYLSFEVARSVPDPAHDNCFVSNVPIHGRGGIHSSHVLKLLEGVAAHAPDLGHPAWHQNAFSMAGPSDMLTGNHFFEPSAVLADLGRMQGIVAAHPQDFPIMHWLRIGNQAGIYSLGQLTSSLSVYHEGQPSMIFGGWDTVEVRPGYPSDASQPRIDLANASSFSCRLRSANPIDLDGLEVLVLIERQPFGAVIATELEAAYATCRWAQMNACLVVPFWS